MGEISRTWDVKNISATFEAILNALRSESLLILHAVRGISTKNDCRISVRLENSNDLNISVSQASGVIPSFGGAGVGAPAASKAKPQQLELF
jgi:hypothetical protein